MLTLPMPSITTSNLGPVALWALLGLASLTSFASASGDSSSEDGGAAASSSEDTDDALGNNNSTEYFSVPAFFITFRETIEVRRCVLAINHSQLREASMACLPFFAFTAGYVCVLPEICASLVLQLTTTAVVRSRS